MGGINMDTTIVITKTIIKHPIPYTYPKRYSSYTAYRVYNGRILLYDAGDVRKILMKRKEVLKWVKDKYGVEYDSNEIRNDGSITRNYT